MNYAIGIHGIRGVRRPRSSNAVIRPCNFAVVSRPIYDRARTAKRARHEPIVCRKAWKTERRARFCCTTIIDLASGELFSRQVDRDVESLMLVNLSVLFRYKSNYERHKWLINSQKESFVFILKHIHINKNIQLLYLILFLIVFFKFIICFFKLNIYILYTYMLLSYILYDLKLISIIFDVIFTKCTMARIALHIKLSHKIIHQISHFYFTYIKSILCF